MDTLEVAVYVDYWIINQSHQLMEIKVCGVLALVVLAVELATLQSCSRCLCVILLAMTCVT